MESPTEGKRFPCPQCGGKLVYDPEEGQMTCPYCGYKAPIETAQAAEEVIVEHDLTEGLKIDSATRWGNETHEFQCKSCMAVITVESSVTATVCPFCGSDQVLPYTATERPIRPESLIPFQVDRDTAQAHFRKWLGRGLFVPNDLKRLAREMHTRLQGIYVPFWTFDADTVAHWHAEAGYYYYETERYTTRDAQGRSVTRTRRVRKVRWTPASGTLSKHFDDVLVPASESIDGKLLRKLSFDTTKLVPFDERYLAGFRAEAYQVNLEEGWKRGQELIYKDLKEACAARVPGDTYRNLRVKATFSNVTFKHALFPIWVAAYRYGPKQRVYRFVVNGQTGEVYGEAPISWWKVLLALLILVVVIAAIAYLVHLFGGDSIGESMGWLWLVSGVGC